jgi:alkylhydroperoxidase family enzyme
MLDFTVQVTEDATRVSRDDLETLRRHGFDDRAILQITLIASWFNYINRVADALGVGRDDPTGDALPIPPPASWAG